MLSRRDLLQAAARLAPGTAALGLAGPAWPLARGESWDTGAGLPAGQAWLQTAPRARYWVSGAAAGSDCSRCHPTGRKLAPGYVHNRTSVKCTLCAKGCNIADGGRGACRARANVGGELRSLVYGRPLGAMVDPIEKKPFYHFLPGAQAYSFGTSGCPLRCRFCQNWELSQSSPGDFDARFTAPADLAAAAAARRSAVIAFTYNEPTVFVEYMLDVAEAARRHGIRSVMVSCGLMNETPLADLCRSLAAIKIDLKGFSEEFYRNVCGAELAPVLRSIRQVARSGVHLELVNLVVPTLNDSDASLRGLVSWVSGELGPDVPLHFTRFYPEYQLQHLPPTPVRTLERARDIALDAGIRYAYVGNVPGHAGNQTYCPGCKKIVLEREGFFATGNNLRDGRCRQCGFVIKGVWS